MHDDLYIFFEEDAPEKKDELAWKILVVGCDDLYHQLSIEFNNFEFLGRKIIFFYANSTQEAIKSFQKHIDIAIILFCFVKETRDQHNTSPDLKLIKYIRAVLKNESTRIIILNDRYGYHDCNDQVISQYRINLYLEYVVVSAISLRTILIDQLSAFVSHEQLKTVLQEKQNVLNTSNRFVPYKFLSLLNKQSIAEIKLTDHTQKVMTVLFMDIRSFTKLSEFLTPIEIFNFVNDFISYLEPTVNDNHGFIDKYIGDCFMVIFPEKADDAVRAGIDMLKALRNYNLSRLYQYQIPIKVGIGINTGVLVMGVIGFYDRMECTVIGDVVNAASRIEGLNKTLGTKLLVSKETLSSLQEPDQFYYRFLGETEIVGKHRKVGVYEIFNEDPEEVVVRKLQTKSDFEQAIMFFGAFNFNAASKLLDNIVATSPHDLPAKYFLERAQQLMQKT